MLAGVCVNGTNGADVLSGTSGDDRHSGLGGNDTLYGGAGNDYLDGGTGDDQMAGGAGNDLYIVDSLGDLVIEQAGEGIDEVRTSLARYALTANVETLRGMSATGQWLIGNDLANIVVGLGGADRLYGADGNDSMAGGDGDDRLYGGEGNDQLNGGNGVDTASYVDAGAGVTVSLAITRMQNTQGAGTDTLTAIENLEGSGHADILTGSAGTNRIDGGAGADQVFGGAGDDVLVGSDRAAAAFDLLDGSTGRDTALYAGLRADYAITRVGDEVRVAAAGASGYDVLRDVEAIAFADGTVDLLATNPPPKLANDQASTNEDSIVLIDVLANDTGSDLVLASASVSGGGIVTIQNGKLLFDPRTAFDWTAAGASAAATITYTATDRFGGSATAFVGVSIAGLNDAPTGRATAVLTGATKGNPYTVTSAQLLAGFADPEGPALGVAGLTASTGTVRGGTDGTFTITQSGAFTGAVELSYRVIDSAGAFATATLGYVVGTVPHAPVAAADSVAGIEDTVLVIEQSALLVNDRDEDGDPLAITAVTATSGGTVALGEDGRITFRPFADFNGVARFNYVVADPSGRTASADVTVAVQSVNDAPVLRSVPTSWSITAGQAFSFSLPADAMVDSDGGQALQYALGAGASALPQWASWNAASRTLSGTAPGGTAAGTLRLTLTGTEPDGAATDAALSISVNAASSAQPMQVSTANGLIFLQRDGTTGALAYTGDAARVTKSGQVVIDWTTGGTITGIPQGDGSTLEVRAGAKVTSAPLAVGIVVEALGQSNMSTWFTDDSAAYKYAESVYRMYDGGTIKPSTWVPATGAGVIGFAATLRAQLGNVPVAIIDGSAGGTRLTSAPGLRTWSDTGAGSLYQNALDKLVRMTNGRAEFVIWNQGETDTGGRVTPDQYATALETLMARTVGDMGNPFFIIAGLSTLATGGDAVRAGQAQAAEGNPNAIYVPTQTDMETIGGTHLTSVGHAWQGFDVAQAALDHLLPSFSRNVPVSGTTNGDTMTGGAAVDRLQGGSGDDVLRGELGNDFLRGQIGNDTLYGGGGNDALSGGTGADVVDGGEGIDDLFGDDGDDRLFGGAGGDFLDGNLGADAMFGGAGDDRYIVDNAGDTVREDDGAGTDPGGRDAVYSSTSFVLPQFVEEVWLTGSAPINGTGNGLANYMNGSQAANVLSGLDGADTLHGQAGNDTLYGGNGNDSVNGGPGADALFGGAGDDIYTVDNLGDTVDERVGGADAGGIDQVQTSVSFALPVFVESLVILGSAAADGLGNGLANVIRGNGASNLLDGAGGDDTLVGNAGDDTLRGGAGADLLQGGDGRDVVTGGAGVDRLTGDASVRFADTFIFAAGDSGVGSGARDVLTDFDTLDRIDLSGIDADTVAAGQQHLSYIGTAAFSAAGQLQLTLFKGYAVLAADLNGDGVADFEIEVSNWNRAVDPGQLLL